MTFKTADNQHKNAAVAPRSFATFSPALQRMQELMQISSRQIITAVLTGVSTLGAAFALAAVSGYLITKAWTMPPVLDLSVAVVSVRALGISRGVFRYLERLFTHDAALTGVSHLRTNLYAGLATSPESLVSSVRRGDLLGRIGDDAEDMANDVIRASVPALVALVMGVIVVATIAPFSPLAAACMIVGLLIASLVAPACSYRAALITERDLIYARSHVSTLTMHVIDNADTLQVAGRFEQAQHELADAQHSFDRALDRAALPSALARACIHLAMVPALLGSILAAGAVFFTPGAGVLAGFMGHTAGIIGVLILLPLSSFEAASVLPQAASQRARTLVAAERLATLDPGHSPVAETAVKTSTASAVRTALRHATNEAQAEINTHGSATPKSDAPTAHAHAPTSARAPQRTHMSTSSLRLGWSEEKPLTLTPPLDAPPGFRGLIYGASGRGKTTYAMTLAGLIPPLAGEVHINGRSIASLPEAEIRSSVVFFAEDSHIFATTLRENIRVVRGGITDTDITNALANAGLNSWLSSLPQGLDTTLGAHGTDVSGGERRRLLLARAIASLSPIIILDEPTEHLDMDLAQSLMRSILTPGDFFDHDTSVLVITHDTRFKELGYPVIDLDTMEGPEHDGKDTAR